MARNGIPNGWSGTLFTSDETKAKERARELRREGKTAKVVRHQTSTLSGRGYTEYIVVTKG